MRALGIPLGFDGPCLNKYGLQTVAAGVITLRAHTVVQQQPDLAPAGRSANMAALARATASRIADGRRAAPFRAVAGARTLGGAESAADRVRKRLQERRESERIGSGKSAAADAPDAPDAPAEDAAS